MTGAPAGAATAARPLLTDEQMERYSRHILLREVGVQGQRRLLDSRVLVVGAGGLGSPALLYLAAAGVGTIGVVDGDRVELNNLQRQVIHTTDRVGSPKVESAARTIAALNPDVQVRTYPTVLSSQNALDIIREYDVVVNGSDNFPTRYLVNDACVLLKRPLVDASVLMWEAQMAVFMPGKGCYRCLYPTPPPPGAVPSCGDAGVMGAMVGHVGTLQALEAIKILLGLGETMDSRLLLFDALYGDYRVLRRQRNPECPVCGDHPTITELVDYEQFCGVPAPRSNVEAAVGAAATPPAPAAPRAAWERPPAGEWEIEPEEAARYLGSPEVQWIDVRQPYEYELQHIPGARLIPLPDLNDRWREIDPDRPAILVCAVGERSGLATRALRRAGYQQVYNLRGGMAAWVNLQLKTESGGPS
ncbi:molybdopterin-synthase adenylyltransferase MoeB [Caldinitratiruptor microaerophilus]|uniref:Molybdenum cofactor biosynthesis protein MoeB n=1 Tax=Caldinitratiruptor microaerophilus TaxID=671077 RepID=A0AA35CL27_9FIRM|nr:molybdopterin-synthase adenylyltransferase MoeB [Caldinitratiruptor microaerophilus]BDG61087.1 molybdenum cofactor biosynthesis protein MoeB [Caldinitratiruptor microaerophilus]